MGTDQEPDIKVYKAATFIPVERSLLARLSDYPGYRSAFEAYLRGDVPQPNQPPPDPGPNPQWLALVEAANGAESGLLAELLAIHEPHPFSVRPDGSVTSWECHGEQPSGYEWDWPEWPCDTVAVIARHVGVELTDVD